MQTHNNAERSRSGQGVEAYDLHLKLKEEGFQPNAVTYLSLLKDYASVEALEWVKAVHRYILGGRYKSDVRVGNSLLYMHAGEGEWSKWIDVESYTYVDVLKQCLREKDPRVAREVHYCIIKCRMEQDKYVASTLLSVYISTKAGNITPWTAMIGAYAGCDWGIETYDLYLKMKEESSQPNAATYMNSPNGCVSIGASEWMKDVHRHILEEGHELDLRVGSVLDCMMKEWNLLTRDATVVIDRMKAKSGSTAVVFDRMKGWNLLTWNMMIGAYARSRQGVKAYEVYMKMTEEGFHSDAVFYMSLLNDCANTRVLE